MLDCTVVRAVVCKEIGPVSTLEAHDAPEPAVHPGQVLIEVAAAGVNYVDALFVQGQYQNKPPVPFVPGSEIAGTVVEVGEGAEGLAVGQRVLASVGLGGFAERVAASAVSCMALPDTLTFTQAATFTQSYSTALFALRTRGGLTPGEVVLVLGGGGGVGLAAIDVARALGATAIAAASSADKRAAALSIGAAFAVDPGTESVKDRAREIAKELGRPTGVDIALDPVGGELAEPALRSLGDGGRYLVIGFASGGIPSLPLNQVLLRNRSVVGVDWGAWSLAHPEEQRVHLAELLDMAAASKLRPTEPATYALGDASAALEDLLGRRIVGKIALVP